MQRRTVLRTIHLATGISGLIFFAAFDLLKGQAVDIGLMQVAGLCISAIIILAGIADWMPWQSKYTLGTLFLLYLVGILFMGLRPGAAHLHHPPVVLSLKSFAREDFVINVLGFVPLGFLTMGFLAETRSAGQGRDLAWTLAFCFAVSLSIELLQVYMPGRTSSMYDLIANAMGALLGGILWDLEGRRTESPP